MAKTGDLSQTTFGNRHGRRGEAAPIPALPAGGRLRGGVWASAILAAWTLFWSSGVLSPAHAEEIVSYALVQTDGSLKVSGRKIWLYGVYIPETEPTCRLFIRPVKCMPRAVLQLDFKVSSYFVHCDPISENEDGSLNAVCRVQGEDIGAWMIKHGWAVALPDAPLEYEVFEEIARRRSRGIWGRTIGP